MDMPVKSSMRHRILKYVHAEQPVKKSECINSLTNYSGQTIANAIDDMVLGGLLVRTGHRTSATYTVTAKVIRSFYPSKEYGETAQPRQINKLFCKPLTGYEASIRRSMRPDGLCHTTGYITSGISMTPFRGVKL